MSFWNRILAFFSGKGNANEAVLPGEPLLEEPELPLEEPEFSAEEPELLDESKPLDESELLEEPEAVEEEEEPREPQLFTVLVQGRLHPHSLECLDVYREVGDVVISHYDDDDLSLLEGRNLKHVTLASSPFIEDVTAYNRGNCYYQVMSTMAGLYCVNTPYVIKVRSDEKYRTLKPVVESVLSSPHALTCTDIYLFPYAFQPLHPSDHLMAGTYGNLARTFQRASCVIQDLKEMARYVTPSRIPADPENYVTMRQRMEKLGKYIASSELILGHAFAKTHGLEPDQVSHQWQKDHFRVLLADSLGCLNKNGVPWKQEHGTPTWPDVLSNDDI